MCIGNMAGGVDSCSADSGGAAICDNLLTGLVSFGEKCGLQKLPGIYTDIVYQNDWIMRNGGRSLIRGLSFVMVLSSLLLSILNLL